VSISHIPEIPAAWHCSGFVREMTRFQFESWSIEDLAGYERGHHVEFDPLFPFSIKLFEYDLNPPPLLNRHEHLEIFVPCGGHGTFAMGSRVLPFAAGDVLIVENLKPHGIQQFHGECPRGMVIAFPPEFVCGPDALPCDSGFLAPFYRQGAARQPILKAGDPQASNVHSALIRLANCYTESARSLRLQSGCKVYLLELLYLLAARLDRPRFMQPESVLYEEESGQLAKLYRFLFANLSERITVAGAASMMNMSESTFMKYFKRATGENVCFASDTATVGACVGSAAAHEPSCRRDILFRGIRRPKLFRPRFSQTLLTDPEGSPAGSHREGCDHSLISFRAARHRSLGLNQK